MEKRRLGITFVTGNARKMKEARGGCTLYGIDVEQLRLDIPEIQSAHPHEVAQNKAHQAFALTGKPVVVSDTFWNIPALNGFPGAYMKDVAQWFSQEDFLNLMRGKTDRRVSFTECITYIDTERVKTFSKEYWGTLVEIPRGTGSSIENVAEFEGHTLGECHAKGDVSHKPEEYIWVEFAKWYTEKYERS